MTWEGEKDGFWVGYLGLEIEFEYLLDLFIYLFIFENVLDVFLVKYILSSWENVLLRLESGLLCITSFKGKMPMHRLP